MFKLLLAILTLFIATPVFAHEESESIIPPRVYIRGVVYDFETSTLTIEGENNRNQLAAVRRAVETHGDDIDTVVMTGQGGMFNVGLDIGMIIFENEYPVVIPDDEFCVSACAIAAIASSDLSIQGTLLFHRPFFPVIPVSASIEEISTNIGRLYLDMTEYLLNIGYSVELSRRLVMLTNHCAFVEIVSNEQLDSFRMGSNPISETNTRVIDRCD